MITADDVRLPWLPEEPTSMGVTIMTVRALVAPSAMYRMTRPVPDGRRRVKGPGPAARHDE
jgi:hypothetical protein